MSTLRASAICRKDLRTPKEFDQYETWCKGIKLPPCGDKQKAKKEAEKLLDDIKEALHRTQ